MYPFSELNFQIFTNFPSFDIKHYEDIIKFNFNYDSSVVKEGFECVDIFIIFLQITLLYLVVIELFRMLFDIFSSPKLSSQSKQLVSIVDNISCVKVPKVFTLVSKEYFETDTNMYLTFVGKLSLGRHLAKNVERVDNTKYYLTQKDPITKKEFRFLCYTPGDIENMKTETRKWIITNRKRWVSYFAY